MPAIQPVLTPNAPSPGGHYSQAMVHNGLVYLAGQLAIGKDGTKHHDATVEAQTELIFEHISAILEAAGSGLEQVISVTIYLADIEDWGKVNSVYTRIFGDHKPARAIVPVTSLHYGLALEVQLIAAVK